MEGKSNNLASGSMKDQVLGEALEASATGSRIFAPGGAATGSRIFALVSAL